MISIHRQYGSLEARFITAFSIQVKLTLQRSYSTKYPQERKLLTQANIQFWISNEDSL